MRKTGALFCIIVLISILSSCGPYSKVETELNNAVIENKLPEVSGGATALSEIKESVYAQQIALCDMMSQAYDATALEDFQLRYSDLSKQKLISLLNDKREEFNNNSKVLFIQNLALLTENVNNIPNKSAYIQKCLDEAAAFLNDYRKFRKESEDRANNACDILRKYSKADNELAKQFLESNRDAFIAYATTVIEENSRVNANIRATINVNNEIIAALNTLYGGAGPEESQRISVASKRLIEKLLHSMETITEDERKQLLEQLDNNDTLTIKR